MKYLVILPLIALAASATPQPTDPQIENAAPGEAGCNAEMLGYLVGQQIGEIDTTTLPKPLRILRPTDFATQDYRLDRWNIGLDEDGRVLRVYCG